MSIPPYRFFEINGQKGIVHLPVRPNGFAVLVIGDVNHFVSDNTSFWIQHPERSQFIQYLNTQGYTVFYSNLYGRHWGNRQSVELLNRMYHFVLKREIINSNIHLLAEGMGALSALKWMDQNESITRSVAFLNPCFSLKVHGDAVKEQKLFYKQFIRELCRSYQLTEKEVFQFLDEDVGINQYHSTLPAKIWHNTQGTAYSFQKHSRTYEKHREEIGAPISLTLQLPGKRKDSAQKVKAFFQQYEHVL